MNSVIPLILAIGTYTANTSSSGIYLVKLDMDSKSFKILKTIPASNPSFLKYIAPQSTLYYAEEVGNKAGTVNAVRLNTADLSVEKISTAKTEGSAPCHVEISPDRKTLVASNYGSGSFATFELDPDGAIGPKLATYQFEAHSAHPTRQKQSHVHSAFYSPDGRNIFVQDLGGDHVYQFGASAIRKSDQQYTTHSMPKGSGPRHLTFSSDNKFVYVINELNGTIDVYALDEKGLIEKHVQNISTDTSEGDNLCAHIRLSSDGKFLYASNRGEKNSIAVYAVSKEGVLSPLQIIKSAGKSPRHFEFAAGGKLLIVANQDTDNVTIFHRDQEKGTLTDSGVEIDIPSPVCIALMK